MSVILALIIAIILIGWIGWVFVTASDDTGKPQVIGEIEEGVQKIESYIVRLRYNGAKAVYIGITNNLGRRKKEHEETIQKRCKGFEFLFGKSFFYITCSNKAIAAQIETACHQLDIEGIEIKNKVRDYDETAGYGGRRSRKVYVCMWEWH